MTKQEFQSKIKALQAKGMTIEKIAKKINKSSRTVRRAKSDRWKGDCSRVYWAFSKVFK